MKISLFLSSLLVAAVSAGVTRTLTTSTTPDDTTATTPSILPTTYPSTPTEEAIVEEEVEKEDEDEEERRVGVNGWLSAPTQAPATSSPKTDATPTPEKQGLCESPKGYGIKCMMRMDQCKLDHHCPGVTKCCMVGECGKLCVKPKPTSTDTKEVTKASVKKNKKEGSKESNKQEEATNAKEIIENEKQGMEEGSTTEEMPQASQWEEDEVVGNEDVTQENTAKPEDEENVTTLAPTVIERN